MAVPSQEASVDAKTTIPWWTRYTRWRQTSAIEGIAAEKALYNALDIPLEVKDVKVGPGAQDFLHTTIVPGKAGQQPPIVWMPGYGAGTGFFFRNFEGFCRGMGFNLHAVDWLGTGLSGRPKYTATTRQEAEDFFIDSLAKWRQEAGLAGSKMVLVGHSLGGYLSAQYALRHPDHVHHLVLVCPAGVPEAPQDWEKRFLGEKWSLRGQLFKWSMALWEKGCTPGSLIRFLGPWGPGIVDKYVAGRFKHHGDGLDEREYRLFKDYFYHIAAAPGSGEYALRHLLAPGAWAYAPLVHSLKDLKVPVTFIYGQHDWMKPEHGVQLCTQLRRERDPAAKHDLKVDIVRDAGHFVFMDQPELFNKALAQVCHEYASPATAAASAADAARSVATSPVVTTWGYDDSRRLSEELHVAADSEASTPQPAASGGRSA